MLQLDIPGYKTITIEHLVFDLNGTLAIDGILIKGVASLLTELTSLCQIHILTADTFGQAEKLFSQTKFKLTILPQSLLADSEQAEQKLNFVNQLGNDLTAFFGNGRNDRLALKAASLGIAVIQSEGASVEAVNAADIVFTDIIKALELFLNPLRIKATLRS